MNDFIKVLQKYGVLSFGVLHHNQYLVEKSVSPKILKYIVNNLSKHVLQLRAGNRKHLPKQLALITKWTKEIVPFKEAQELKILIPSYIKTCPALPTIYLVYGFTEDMDLVVITGIKDKYLVKKYEKPSLAELSFSMHTASYVGDQSSAVLREQVKLQGPERDLITGPFLGFFFLEEETAPINLYNLTQIQHLAMVTKAYQFLRRLQMAKKDPKKAEFLKKANIKGVFYFKEGE